jgi:hypothetical protein
LHENKYLKIYFGVTQCNTYHIIVRNYYMENRNAVLIGLRPTIESSKVNAENEIELFQNTTLRPILKFQNELILSYFYHNTAKRITHLKTLPEEQLLLAIKSELNNNLPFRNTLIGSIVGLFTLAEFDYYLNNERELKKRLISMLLERIFSQQKQLLQ